MSVQAYRFQLTKLSSKQLQLEAALFALFGHENIFPVLQQSLAKHARAHPRFHLETWRSETGTEALSKFSDTSVTVAILLPNRKQPFLFECDVTAARQFIEHTLGGRETKEVSGSALSNIELGVLQYLLLQILADLSEASGQEKVFQLQHIAQHGREAASLLRDDEMYLALTFRLQERNFNHFVRCLFPHGLLHEELAHAANVKPAGNKIFSDPEFFNALRSELWCEAGSAALAYQDLRALEPGDVLLFDQAKIDFHEQKIHGPLCLRVGTGRHAAFSGKLLQKTTEHMEIELTEQLGEEV